MPTSREENPVETALPPAAVDYQYVPVPNEHVHAVYTLLASLITPNASPAAHNSIMDTDNQLAARGWDDLQLSRLMARTTETTSFLVEVVDRLSEVALESGETAWRSNAAIAQTLHLDPATVKNRWSKLPAHLRKHYPGVSGWPILTRSGDRVDSSWPPAVVYGISVDDARAWMTAKMKAAI